MPLLTSSTKLNGLLITTYIGYFGLLILFFVNFFTNHDHSLYLLLFQTLPLLLVVKGLVLRHFRAFSWLCFIILAYFTAYSVEVMSDIAKTDDWVGLLFSMMVFVGAMLSSRGLQRL